MPGSQIIYDGLWRCLCPSVGPGTLTRALRPRPRRMPVTWAALNNCERRQQQRHSSSAGFLTRALPETAESIEEHETQSRQQYFERADKRAPWLNRKLLSMGPDVTPDYLDQFSTQHIYEALKEVQSMEHSYHTIIKLVEFLIAHRKEAPNALLYEALIRANVDPFLGTARAARDLLTEMKEIGLAATPGVYHAILQVTAVHPDYVLRSKALLEMKHRWYTPTLDGNISIILGLLRDGQYELGLEKLEELARSPVIIPPWLFSIFLVKFGELGFRAESFQILQHAVKVHNPQRSLLAWAFLLDVYSRDAYYAGITFIWERMVASGRLTPSDGVCLQVLNTAAQEGDVGLATSVIQLLRERRRKLGMHHYEALVDANMKRGDLEKAFTVLCLMRGQGLVVDASSTRSIFSKLQESDAEASKALLILRKLRVKHKVPIAAFNVILEAIISHRGFDTALDTYRSVRLISSDRPDLRTFHILLSQCTKENHLNFMIAEMEAFSVKPNRTTYNRLIRITARLPSYEPAFRYIRIIKALRKPTDTNSDLWMSRSAALELIKRCVQNHDPRAQELLMQSRARGMGLDGELEEFIAHCQENNLFAERTASHREATTSSAQLAALQKLSATA